jgi:hypothetical protein
MRAKHTWIILIGLLVLMVPFLLRAQAPTPAKTPDVAGIWALTMQTPQGEMAMDATFTQDKEAIKVSMMSPMGTEMKGEGTIKGQDLVWTMAISTPNGDFSLAFKAKLDGDSMTGEVQMGDFGTSTFTAKKKK